MEYTKEQLSADLLELKSALEKDFEEKADSKITAKLEEVNKAILELKEIKPEVTALELKAIKDDLDLTIKAVERFTAKVNATPLPQNEVKSFDQRLREAVEESHDNLMKFQRKEIKKFEMEIKAVGAVSTANVGGSTLWGAQGRNDIVMNPNRRQHIRDLMSVLPAGPGTDFYFMYENGAGEGSIAATSETTAAAAATTQATGLKPQFDIDFVEASVKFEIIAGWMLMSKKAMNNIPGFLAALQKRIPEKLLNAEDAYLLYGNGTSPQIKGILASGNFVAGSAAGSTPLVEKIINDMSLLEDTHERMATGIVLRPADYYTILKNKASGSGEYDLPENVAFVNGKLYILGVPVAKTTALTAGDYVVGDFAEGADIMMQESMKLEFFEQDGTNVRTNQITVRIEETIALPVYGSNYFVKGSSLLA